MGDNLYLGDRDSVRTPMQWSPDRNGGFSRADFAQLYLPPLMDPIYGFAAVNVEAQQRNPSSFLHWMRRMLAVRRQFPVFGTGSVQMVTSANPSVLAFVRADRRAPEAGREVTAPVLCVHNLSRMAQPATVDLADWAGRQPVELLGRVAFPLIGSEPYAVTLGPYGSLSFELV